MTFKDVLTSQIPWVFPMCNPTTPGWKQQPNNYSGKTQRKLFMYLSYLVIKESSEAIKTKNPYHSCFKAMNSFWLNWTMNCCFKQQFHRPKSWASGMFEYWCWLSKSGQKNCVQPQTTGHFFRLCSFEWGSSKLQARCKTQDNKNICEKEPRTSVEEAQGWKTGVGSSMVTLVLSFSRRRTWKQKVSSINWSHLRKTGKDLKTL